ncbi:iron reductase [Wolfiporia cocos MD-104 SS10]|uniref:ferric-chelate reductase (NADPH) n=1 Tax=Wolfiporia cocos (strain MD-104) TaxID=742152 RepID=A0A2H3JL06_WOLCO|nr:iron reductase [Wolfiporia cocos MD-104 SS10]
MYGADSSEANLVFYTDVLLLCVAAVFVILALPRAVARFMSMSWTEGLVFYSSHISSTQRKPPIHVPSLSTISPQVAAILSTTIRPDYTIGKLVIFLLYFAVMLYSGLVDSNPFTNPGRAGLLAISQVPVVILFATKNNVFGTLIGKGYEKFNYLHRFVGRCVILAINTHALGFSKSCHCHPTSPSHADVHISIIWGIVALACMDILFLFSVSTFRQMFYHVFYMSHVFAAILMMVAACMHIPPAVPYALTGVGLYGLDRLVRIVQTSITTACLRPIPELSTVLVELPTINAGWRAGQHLRIKVLSSRMGWLGCAESHPFTIANVSENTNGEGLVLMCKKAGDWTSKLYELAQSRENTETGEMVRKVKVLIDSPYGGLGHANTSSFCAAMIVAGGSGITYGLATIEELLRKATMGQSHIRTIQLVWSVSDAKSLIPLLPLFGNLLYVSQATQASLHISVFYTRAVTSEDVLKSYRDLPSDITLSPGRPRLNSILDSVVSKTLDSVGIATESRNGVVVGVCGPIALGDEVSNTVRAYPKERQRAIGGIELHEEIFGR